jgi:hypothetical protein
VNGGSPANITTLAVPSSLPVQFVVDNEVLNDPPVLIVNPVLTAHPS